MELKKIGSANVLLFFPHTLREVCWITKLIIPNINVTFRFFVTNWQYQANFGKYFEMVSLRGKDSKFAFYSGSNTMAKRG